MKKHHYIPLIYISLFFGTRALAQTVYAENQSRTLFSYAGYLGVPSADIHDGMLSFDYTFLPDPVAFHKENIETDNWIFSSSLGFFPFLECYVSVFVEPQNDISYSIPGYGSGKYRSFGAKIKIIKETKRIPSIAFGLHEPGLSTFGASKSNPNVSSTFIVMTKHDNSHKHSLSLGYGFDNFFKGEYQRLNGVFFGMKMKINETVSILIDYDAEYWGQGASVNWHGINMVCGLIDWNNIAFRIGYNFDLLSKIKI